MRIPTILRLIPILLAAGGLTLLTAQSIAVDKSTMTFSAQFGGPVVSQQLNITSSAGTEQFSIFSSTTTNPQWLKISGQTVMNGTTPSAVTVTADPTGLNPGNYSATLTVFGALSSQSRTVNVTLTVSTIGASPSSVTFAYTQGGAIPSPQPITLSGTGGYTAAVATATGGPWLSVNPTSGTVPGGVIATLNASVVTGLAVGTYQGTVTITPVTSGSPVAVPVTLQVLPTPPVSVNPATMIFNAQQGGTNNIATQTLTISTTPGQQMNFLVQGSVSSGPNWITLSPTSGNTDPTTGTAQVTVGYSLTGLTVNNTYTGNIVLFTSGGTPPQTNIPVTLNYSANPLLNVPTNTLNFTYQLGGATPAAKSVNITATSGSLNYAISQSANSGWLSVPNAGNTAAPISVSVNPAGLTPGTYTATISVTSATPGSTAQQIPVVLKVSNDPMIVTNTSGMSFAYQIGQAFGADRAQTLKITSSTGTALNYTATPIVTNCGSNWLQLNGGTNAISGGTDASITVSIVAAGLTTPATCTGTINITATNASTGAAAVNSPVSIPVTVIVATSPLLVATPASISFSATSGSSPGPQTIALTSTSGSADTLNYTITSVSGTSNGITWLFAGPTSGNTASSSTLTVSIFSSTLPAGTYSGTITVAATKSDGTTVLANSPVVIPVTLQVTAGSLTLGTTSMSFTYTVGASSPNVQSVVIGSTNQPLSYTAVAASTPTAWLTVNPTSGTTNAQTTVSVGIDGTKLTSPGTFTGTITVTSPGAGNSPAVINVTVTVSAGTISAPTTTLSFSQVAGGAAPAAQTIAVTGSPAPLSFTVAASTTPAGGTWLTATPASGTTPGSISVSVNGASLTPGQYSGQVTITSTGATGSPITVPVVLNVTSPATVTASPTSLNFNYTIGLQTPASQTLTIGTTTPVAITAAVQYQGSANGWLTVAPTQTSAPASLAVSVTPGTLTAGTYNANITISSPNLITPLTVPVVFTILAIPKPVIVSVGNAANYSTGPLSPGENIVIFGTGIGPAALAQNGLTNNAFGTVVGGTRVLFDGVPAPMLYASATQTSAMVPYGVFGRTSTNIVVEYSGVQSTGLTYNVVGAAPGIYTLNQAGTGPGAIINQDGVTVNGPNAPEKRGNIISVYMTGEGQTSPPGVDGAIIPPVLSALKMPILPVTATVGGLPAVVQYAGSAAGLVSGVMQVNLTIPANAPTGGAVPIVVTVGTFNSQGGVTVAVQ